MSSWKCPSALAVVAFNGHTSIIYIPNRIHLFHSGKKSYFSIFSLFSSSLSAAASSPTPRTYSLYAIFHLWTKNARMNIQMECSFGLTGLLQQHKQDGDSSVQECSSYATLTSARCGVVWYGVLCTFICVYAICIRFKQSGTQTSVLMCIER